MTRFVRLDSDALHDLELQRLPPEEFREAFLEGMRGRGLFARYLRPGNDRPSFAVWAELRAEAFRRDGFRCVYCGAGPGVRLECDHIVPVSRGGSNGLDNLATACIPCNRAKGARSPQEWRQ